MEKDVSSSKITAAEVAQLTFDAIRAERFYVLTHPEMLPAVQDRFDGVFGDGGLGDPFATNPVVKPQPLPAQAINHTRHY